ncbi:phage terminase small subunit [Granulicatella balaenopterae]|uniref:Phage terminase small subunit n=1 Tax=Granulicatella balaenopterae TaxID=137733 RepID=A0A1H9IMQ8_9LACT|nr:terminase small subunit [Granulicatella balaenopterae]SEQ75893.1 phage terminase small subunit [Granulicatella balaenopterae]
MAEMTPKQQKFADEYIISGNATDAAKKAGYSEKTARYIGSENLTKPVIKNYIDERMKEYQDKQIATQEEVLNFLTNSMIGEVDEEVVVTVGTGDGRSAVRKVRKEISAKDRIKAAELLGKRYGIWTDKQQIESVAQVVFIDDITDDITEDDIDDAD